MQCKEATIKAIEAAMQHMEAKIECGEEIILSYFLFLSYAGIYTQKLSLFYNHCFIESHLTCKDETLLR